MVPTLFKQLLDLLYDSYILGPPLAVTVVNEGLWRCPIVNGQGYNPSYILGILTDIPLFNYPMLPRARGGSTQQITRMSRMCHAKRKSPIKMLKMYISKMGVWVLHKRYKHRRVDNSADSMNLGRWKYTLYNRIYIYIHIYKYISPLTFAWQV